MNSCDVTGLADVSRAAVEGGVAAGWPISWRTFKSSHQGPQAADRRLGWPGRRGVGGWEGRRLRHQKRD